MDKTIVLTVVFFAMMLDPATFTELSKDGQRYTNGSENLVTISIQQESVQDNPFDIVKTVVTNVINNDILDRNIKGDDAAEAWLKFGDAIQDTVSLAIRPILPRLLEFVYVAELGDECLSTLTNFIFDVMQTKTYAMRAIDSWGKVPPAMLETNLAILGDYDECLKIKVADDKGTSPSDDGHIYFRGQYCMIHATLALPPISKDMTIFSPVFNFTNTRLEGKALEDLAGFVGSHYQRPVRLGLCVPSACSSDEIDRLLHAVLSGQEMLKAQVHRCEIHEPPKWENYQILIIVFFSLHMAIIIIGTVVDLTDGIVARYGKDTLRTFRDFTRCFSVRINAKEILTMKAPPGDISALHGIRVLSMTWLIYSHTFLLPIKEVFRNARTYIYIVQDLIFQGIMNGFLIVDTFFFMSALLFTYTSLRKLEKAKGKFNIPQTIFNRIYRLFFPLFFSVLFVFIWLNLSRGPLWNEVIGWQVERCQRSWWATLLFFSNFIDNDNICLEHSWYLGADMQLFILFIPVLIVLFKWQKSGLSLIFALISLGALSSAITVYATGLSPVPLYSFLSEKRIFEVIHIVHLWPNFHIATYGIGTLTGFILYKKQKINIPKAVRLVGWVIAAIFGLIVIWFSYFWNNNELKNTSVYMFFAAFQRIFWGFTLAWVTYLCASGNGGTVNNFLSAPIFLPLSRLTFVVYIIHQLIIWTRDGIKQQGIYFSHYNMFCEFVVNTVFSFFMAFFFHLVIEAPFSMIHKKYLTKIFQNADITINNGKHPDDAKDISTKL